MSLVSYKKVLHFFPLDIKELHRKGIQRSGGFRDQQGQTMEHVRDKNAMKVISTSPHCFADLVFCF